MMWLTLQVWSPQNTIPNCHDQLDSARFMMKTRQDNDMTYRTGLLYFGKEIELSWPIGQDAAYQEK